MRSANLSRRAAAVGSLLALAVLVAGPAIAQTATRWTDPGPAGVFFNDYDPNFYTGWAPRVQDKDRIKIHLARGNQLRVRMVLPDDTLDYYLPDQVAKHDLYKEVIDKGVITLTSNMEWEKYTAQFEAEDIRAKAARKDSMSPEEWRALNVEVISKLNPERMYHIQKNVDEMVEDWSQLLSASAAPTDLEGRLELINELFPHRIFAYELTPEQTAAFDALVGQAKAGDTGTFRSGTEAFFTDITGGIYAIDDGKIDYWEYTAIYPAGTYDTTTTVNGRVIPMITTPGIWYFMPRDHGNGMLGMIDYISRAGYYGLVPMFPYEYGGGVAYNSIHNTGISNWIGGHPLLPKEWKNYTEGSRNGKPYNRVALTSRGPVSHGCTRLGSGHLAELRELLPSTSEGMRGLVNYRNVSHCYDVFDRKGDGDLEIMGVQYYFAFRHTKSRVANQIWAQNNREDFYKWLYGDEMNYGPVGSVTFPDVCEAKFVERKTKEGRHYEGLTLYEAPYKPESMQFYKINGMKSLSNEGMDFNRELRRVGHGYTIDRAKLKLN